MQEMQPLHAAPIIQRPQIMNVLMDMIWDLRKAVRAIIHPQIQTQNMDNVVVS